VSNIIRVETSLWGKPVSTQPADPAASASGTQDSDAAQFTKPHRQLAAFVLLAVNAVYLLLAFGDIFVVTDAWVDGFTTRASNQFGAFAGFTAVVLPLLAALLATHVRPVVRNARPIVVFAIVEYLASAVFGVISMLSGLIRNLSDDEYHTLTTRGGVEEFVARSGALALLLVAAMIVMRVYQGMYAVASPSLGYGQGGYGQQVGYSQAQQAAYAQQQQAYAQQAAYAQQQQAYAQAQQQAYAQQQAAAAGAAAGTQQAGGQGGYGYAGQQGSSYPAAGGQYPGYAMPAAQPQPEASSPFASYAAPASAPPAPASAPPGSASPVSGGMVGVPTPPPAGFDRSGQHSVEDPTARYYPGEAQPPVQPSSPVSAMPADDPDQRTHLIQPGPRLVARRRRATALGQRQ
jgi:hypothetical protein